MQAQPEDNHLEVRRGGKVIDVTVVGCNNFGEQNVSDVRDQLLDLAAVSADCRIYLNFTHVDSISSCGLGALLAFRKGMDVVSGQLVLCNLSPSLYEVFEVTRLNSVFNIRAGPYTPASGQPPPG